MATPLGHSLLGLTFGRMSGSAIVFRSRRGYFFSILAANAADLDFVPGLLMGDINRFHQEITHTLLASIIFGGMVVLVSRSFCAIPLRMGMASVGLYASHLLLDFFCEDKRAPFGQPLLWPFSLEYFISPWPIFGGVRHGIPGQDFQHFCDTFFHGKTLKC